MSKKRRRSKLVIEEDAHGNITMNLKFGKGLGSRVLLYKATITALTAIITRIKDKDGIWMVHRVNELISKEWGVE